MDLRVDLTPEVASKGLSLDAEPSEANPYPAPIYNPQINQNCHVSESYSFFGDCSKLILVMVGLPARGKTYISRKISRYLSWLGFKVRSFNIGQYRRRDFTETVGSASVNFFDPHNEEAVRIRRSLACLALEDLYSFLLGDGEIAILDGTNSTRHRRDLIREFLQQKEADPDIFKLLFVESICTDDSIVEENISSCKLGNPDYQYVDPETAVADFRARIACYETVYSEVADEEGAYIKIINAGQRVVGHEVHGYLPGRIMYFLMHLNLVKKPIFFSRHGESQYNECGRIGGNAPLSEEGEAYAHKLADFMFLQPESRNMKTYCSTLRRTIQTSEPFSEKYGMKVMKWRALSEIEVGDMDGLTLAEFREKYPEDYQSRQDNKLTYRYPGGESYRDVIQRLEPVIFELERSRTPVLVIGHRAVLRCLYAYFVDCPEEKIPWLPIKLHKVYKCTPKAYNTEVQIYDFGMVQSELREGEGHTRNVTLPHMRTRGDPART